MVITSSLKQKLRYSITDIDGRIIRTNNIVASAGQTSLDLNVRPGYYVLKLSNAKGIHKTEKILVL